LIGIVSSVRVCGSGANWAIAAGEWHEIEWANRFAADSAAATSGAQGVLQRTRYQLASSQSNTMTGRSIVPVSFAERSNRSAAAAHGFRAVSNGGAIAFWEVTGSVRRTIDIPSTAPGEAFPQAATLRMDSTCAW
jgi:hypothetical protein